MSLSDKHDRQISYLRLSVTDQCNLRCRYCVPQSGLHNFPKMPLLSFEDLYRVARQSALLGIRKIRVTGGEPLVRPGIVQFLERVNGIPGIGEVVLTTNGILLDRMADPLRRAGVKRLNISLDSLKPETFAAITGGGNLTRVLEGIAAAERAGFPPPQINVVVLRGINSEEILSFAAMAIDWGLTVRFIEYMPVNGDCNWNSSYINSSEILAEVGSRHRLTPMPGTEGAGPARYFRLDDSLATIGVISPISKHFCASCNRIRITSDGQARGCLFSPETIDLKPYLLRGDEAVREVLTNLIQEKPLRHNLLEGFDPGGLIPMSAIGG